MRHILVDFARARLRAERGGFKQQVSLEEAAVVSKQRSADFIALDDALKSLAEIDPRKSRLVELRFFGGLGVEETAEARSEEQTSELQSLKRLVCRLLFER